MNYLYNNVYLPSLDKVNISNIYSAIDSVGRGKKVLENNFECDTYTALYGSHHYYKLNDALTNSKLKENIKTSDIEIIDWGAGQAFGSIMTIEYLLMNNINISHIEITLIDKSSVSISKGEKYLEKLLKKNNINYKINKIAKPLNSLNFYDIKSNQSKNKIHIFSNIIDVPCFDINRLVNYFSNMFKGKNYIIATSPNNYSAGERFKRFYNLLLSNYRYNLQLIRKNESYINGKLYYFKSNSFNYKNISRIEKQILINN